MAQLVIIGGSDAGISAAFRAREVDPSLGVTVVVADEYPNFSICGLPFFLSGEVEDWRTLAHRTIVEIEAASIRLLLNCRAEAIDSRAKRVRARDRDGRVVELGYDKLIIATGAASVRPDMEGLDLPGVFCLRWMEDGFRIREFMERHRPERAIILGSGYIGMEMADALTRKGLSVTVLLRSGRALKTVDAGLGEVIRSELTRNGVRLIDRIGVTAIEKRGRFLVARNTQEIPEKGEMVLAATGARPESALAQGAGVTTGIRGAIKVNRALETNIEDVYAAGDCVETWHRLLGKYTYLPLGTTAHKQGRVAGENAAGGKAQFAGSLGTQSVKIFDLVVARTGLLEQEARDAGFDPLTVDLETWDHKVYYPGATPLRIRITGDRKTGRLLGAQMVGHHKAEVSKRIDVFATALFNEMTVSSLNDIDLSYTPPLSSPWDPVQQAAQEWNRKKESCK
ncbi:MAG: CoA-disulfide reductase [Deltaproteobacteria bacterium HGW-Deltaproteobacteria-21]|nr:MAG: CoA-disulfide reductase [Deltaproteobacteria bacterium HGW-Deltaproteobacteria-21]